MTGPPVELWWWEGCPSTGEGLRLLRDAVAAAGGDPDAIAMREIATDEEAGRTGFPGSPTFVVDGRDVLPPPAGEPSGLTCRLYRLPDGRPSPTPDPDDLRRAVARALADRSDQ